MGVLVVQGDASGQRTRAFNGEHTQADGLSIQYQQNPSGNLEGIASGAGQGEGGEAVNPEMQLLPNTLWEYGSGWESPQRGLSNVLGWVWGTATHYGESYNGQPLGCGGIYDSNNPTILAVGPANYGSIPCGTGVQVCSSQLGKNEGNSTGLYSNNTGGEGYIKSVELVPKLWCIEVIRRDSCPGCGPTQLDLSEAGFAELGCVDVCQIVWRIVE